MVDTLGLMLGIVVHPANVQDRDGAEALLRQTRRSFPFIEVIFADGGYQGPIMAAVTAKTGKWRLEIVKRNDVPRFEVLPKRWIVERTLAWISHCRRLARDFERHVRTLVTFRLSCHDPAHAPPPHSNPLSLDSNFRNGS
jgi:transposase